MSLSSANEGIPAEDFFRAAAPKDHVVRRQTGIGVARVIGAPWAFKKGIMQAVNSETEPVATASMWRSFRRFWCRHADTFVTPKTTSMPAHIECRACGWREPVVPEAPIGTRTWDSSRDEYRYLREKRRRTAVEEQRQDVIAQLSIPTPTPVAPRRRRRSNVIKIAR